MRGQIQAREASEIPRPLCSPTVIDYVSWPSIEAFDDLRWRRTREGPGCIVVNGLLIVDRLCPACAAKRLEQPGPRFTGPSGASPRG